MEKIIFILLVFFWFISLFGNYYLNEVARKKLHQSFDQRREITEKIEKFQTFYNDLKNAETGQRGYLLTGDSAFLKPYKKALENLPLHQEMLAQEKEKDYKRSIEKIEELVSQKFLEMKQVLDLYQKQGFPMAQNKVKEGLGRNLMEEIEAEVNSIVQILDERRIKQDKKIEDNLDFTNKVNILGNLVFLFLTFGFTYFLFNKMKKLNETYKTLKKAQSDLNFTLEEARLGTWEWDLKNGNMEVSSFTRALFGIEENKELNIDVFFNKLLPEDREKVSEKLYQVISERENFSGTYRVLLPSGAIRSLTSRGRTFVDDQNQPEKMLGICWDVTTLSHSYNLLQVSYGVSRVLNDADSIHDAMHKIISILDQAFGWKILVLWIYNESKRQLECVEIFHKPNIEVPSFRSGIKNLSVSSSDSVPNQVFSSYRPIWYEDFSQEGRLMRSDAAKKENIKGALAIPIIEESSTKGVLELFKFVPLAKDEIDQGVLNLMTTIGIELGQFIKKREAYNNVRKMDEKYKQVIEISEEWIYETDANLNFTFTNHRVEKILGYTAKEVLGKIFYSFIPLEERENIRKKCHQYVVNKRGWSKWNIAWQAKGGAIHQMESNAIPIFDDQNELIGFRGTNRDITEFLRIEKSKDEFISVVSHELRTPLTSIHGALGLINSTLTNLPEDVKELLEIAYRNSDRLTRIINDILDVEKIRLGKLEIKLESCSLAEIIRDSMRAAMPLAQKSQIDLIEGSEFPPLNVLVDKERLIQVMLNLLNNAISFSFPNNAVTVSILEHDKFVRISVHDDGIGISEEFKHRIFNKFAQADSSDSRSGKGTGLGLSISKSLIESFGGKIGFNSVLGKGTTFFIDLPIHLEEGQ